MGRRDVSENDFSNFEDFLDAWSRRDFLRGMGGSLAFTTFLAGGMELLAACGGGNSGTQTNTQNAKRGGHVVEGNPTDIANLNPLYINDVYSQTIAYRLYDALLSIDNQANLLPNLATDVPKVSSDGLSYTFKLHKGVQWSDGQPLTADDVAFTYQLMYAPEWKGAKARYRPQAEQYIQSVTAADPQTVVIKTTKVFAPFLITFCTGTSGTGGILPKHVWEKLRPEAMPSSEMNNLPTVVSGAMAPVKWDKGSQYVIKRNDNWFRGKTYIDQHVFKVTPSFVANANLLKTGEIDIGIVDNSVWDDLANSQSVNRVGFTRPSYDYYLHNLDASKTPKAAIFGDSQVRKALYTALDKKKIADKVYFGQATPADSIMSSAQWAHTTPKTQYPYDLAKANKMLDDAGWKKGPDGIRSKGGVKMEWELRTNAGNAVRETLITVLADQWKQIGANVATKPVQFPQLVTQLSQTRDFEMILLGISENADPDQTQYYKSTSIGNGALNGSGYKNPEIDSLLDEGVQTVDRNKRKDVYAKIQDILMQDLPTPLVTYPKGLWGISKRVQNFGVGPWNQYGARPWYKDVYVSDGK
ncbi:MAG: ABC transporter substrate-binding protein [Candidatus Dormibacteraeota bacterium]|nr:ABC transporter substrate-binding protein [Candidatus Dormibacteraeota bacterium]